MGKQNEIFKTKMLYRPNGNKRVRHEDRDVEMQNAYKTDNQSQFSDNTMSGFNHHTTKKASEAADHEIYNIGLQIDCDNTAVSGKYYWAENDF